MRPLECPTGFRYATRKDEPLLRAFVQKEFLTVGGWVVAVVMGARRRVAGASGCVPRWAAVQSGEWILLLAVSCSRTCPPPCLTRPLFVPRRSRCLT